jgi:hypothetical protein
MFWAEWMDAVAIGIAANTRSGKLAAHCRTSMPPMEPPATQNKLSMPRWSSSMACARTMSLMVTMGKSSP